MTSKNTGCPSLSVDLGPHIDEIKDAVRRELKEEMGMEAEHNVHRMGGIRFIPSQFKAVEFGMGVITIPAFVGFSARLLEKPGFIVNKGVSRPLVHAGATLIALGTHLATGASSFTLGAVVGLLPSMMDELARIGADAVMGDVPSAPTSPAAAVAGIGNREQEINRLRRNVEAMRGIGESAEGNASGGDAIGSRVGGSGVMVVR